MTNQNRRQFDAGFWMGAQAAQAAQAEAPQADQPAEAAGIKYGWQAATTGRLGTTSTTAWLDALASGSIITQ